MLSRTPRSSFPTLLRFGALMGCAVLLSACWWDPSPAKINRWIDEGEVTKALNTLESELNKNDGSAALHLLAAKAYLLQCAERNCPKSEPTLLTKASQHMGKVMTPVALEEGALPMGPRDVILAVLPKFSKLSPQPAGVMALWGMASEDTKAEIIDMAFQRALDEVHAGKPAVEILKGIGNLKEASKITSDFALGLAAMFSNEPAIVDSHIISLRSQKAEKNDGVPPHAAALIPWGQLALAKVDKNKITAEDVLNTLPGTISGWKIDGVLTDRSRGGLAAEFNEIAKTPALLAVWKQDWEGDAAALPLMLQRLSLSFNPNQPDMWAIYLPALIHAVSNSKPLAGMVGEMNASSLADANLSPETREQLGTQLLEAAGQLTTEPAAAAPLLVLADSLKLSKPQQVELDKMTQDMLVKASEQSDVTTTVMLAKFKPEVALNNRQSVVPLLVTQIRQNLRNAQFEQAMANSEMLQKNLKMDVPLDPIIIQEFTEQLKRDNIANDLKADNFEVLLQPAETAELDLGPLFDFMREYFADQPTIISSQLTTLIANASGVYGPATAMYRLGHLFPESTMPAEKRDVWLNNAVTEAMLADESMTGPDLARTAAKMLTVHPTLGLAPIFEHALKRGTTLEDQREIWQDTSGTTRNLLETIRPQFAALMRGIDALQAKRLNAAAKAFGSIDDPQWYEQAKPYMSQFQERLVDIAGVYVPVSNTPGINAAAVILAPVGLDGGPLQAVSVTFINRLGTLEEDNPNTLIHTASVVRRMEMTLDYNFDQHSLPITAQVLNELPKGATFTQNFGKITELDLQFGGGTTSGTLMMMKINGKSEPVTMVRALVQPLEALRPDGVYQLQNAINQPVSGTETILPTSTMMNVVSDENLQAASEEFRDLAAEIYPISGSLRHPASNRAIDFIGAFDPQTLVWQFTFSYPLPVSKLQVKAAVRCQALAGPLVCATHHTHSPRMQYSTLVSGMQTRESIAETVKLREELNQAAHNQMLVDAQQIMPTETSATTISDTTQVTPTMVMFKPGTNVPTLTSPSVVSDTNPSPTTPALAPTPEQELISRTVTLGSGEEISKSQIKPGTFIHRVSSPTTSPTAP